ncbi:MAG: T9SS type A sorting domain-containing protein [Bacteroidales bacterium]|nr:T9SS type A sorting domain-containing protein [Bacteroidales bacterium]
MKRFSLFLVMMAFAIGLTAQTEITFDFNDYLEESNINGQHGWVSRVHSAGNGGNPLYTGYFGPRGMTTPDETIGVFSVCSGTSFGDIATHSLSEYGFDFSTGGVIEIECDMWREWWGDFFGIGYDGNGDGVVLPPILGNYEPIRPNPNSTAPDGGIYMLTTGVNETNANFKNGVVLPNNTFASTFTFEPHQHWYRWKVSIDLDANNGAGAVTLYMIRDLPGGEWEPVPECQGINIGLTPGSGDKFDPAMWNGIFMLNSGYGGFDNFTVRHTPGGLDSQFIEFAEIADQLVYNAPITLNATASSGLPVTFEVAEGPATVNGNILTLTGEEGTVKVRAMQPGDGTQWQAAPTVTRSFYVVNPENYAPEITIRRPYEGTKVYMPDFENPVMIVLSAYIEHGNAIKFEEVKCNVDGQELWLKTDYPDKPSNGYWYTTWTPSGAGTYNMTVSIKQTGGKVTTVSNSFEVVTDYDNIVVTAMNGDLVVGPGQQTNYGEYAFPTHVNAFNAINLHYQHNCVNGNCDSYDRVGYCRVKNYRGEWVELYRYVTPFGVQCEDNLDVTDFTSLLQGLVEFEVYCQTWTGSGYNPTAIFEYTKGTPDYPYVDMLELWFGAFDFGDYDNPCPIPSRRVEFEPSVEKANLRLVTTGHNWSSGTNGNYNTGNAAEFYEATHNIKINGTTAYTQHLWCNCSPNPAGCQPQNGTWAYPRSGWCPGSFGMVWNYSLDDYLANGSAELLYEFDPTYIDECHPNFPDCVTGQNSCPNCQDSDNPILRVSGKLVTYSHLTNILLNTSEHPDVDAEPFNVAITPNPVKNNMTITTDYEQGRVSVHILNAQGVEVRGFSMKGSATIDMSDLPSGLYFVNVIGGKVVTKKVVIE